MKWIVFLSIFLSTQIKADDYDYACYITAPNDFKIENFAHSLMTVADLTGAKQKVLDVTVTKWMTNQGRGSVSVYTDKEGELTGIKVEFYLNGKKEVMVKTVDELKNGEKLEYKESGAKSSALVVKKASGKSLYSKTGGEFTFSILTKKPSTYAHHALFIRKVAGVWVVKNENGNQLSAVDLTPNVSGMEWSGTFSKASFE